jgi:hypothetical protein
METKSTTDFWKAALFAFAVFAIFLLCWETYWRTRGFFPTFNDDESYWSNKRKDVYKSPAEATVFIGSSRINLIWMQRFGKT